MNRWQHGAIVGITGLFGFLTGISFENRYTPQERMSFQPKQRIYDTAEELYKPDVEFKESLDFLVEYCLNSKQTCGLYAKRISGNGDSMLSELHARAIVPLINDQEVTSFLSEDIPPREVVDEGLGEFLVPEKPFEINKTYRNEGSYSITEVVNPSRTRSVQYWDEDSNMDVDFLLYKNIIDPKSELPDRLNLGIEDSTREVSLSSSRDLRNIIIALAAKKEDLLDTSEAADLFMDMSIVPRRFPVDYHPLRFK